jgi:hypothetical protein
LGIGDGRRCFLNGAAGDAYEEVTEYEDPSTVVFADARSRGGH